MRRTRLAAVTVAVAGLAIAAPSASADTIGGVGDATVVGGQVSFVSGGATYSGYAQVEQNNLTGERFVSWYFSPDAGGAARTCDADTPDDPSDDYVGHDYVEWDADQSRILEFTIKSSFAGATVKLRATGPNRTFNACTGETVRDVTETHALELVLKASGPLIVDTEQVTVDNGDGTTSPGTSTAYYRDQAAKVLVDGKTGTGVGMSIQRGVTVRN
jgi:hypothetical protein